MKKLRFLFGMVIAVLVAASSMNVMAQDQVVTQGSTHTYQTPPPEPTLDYNWSVTGGNTISGATTNSTSITWDAGAGTYTITVFPTNTLTGCSGNNETFEVEVVGANIIWDVTAEGPVCPTSDNQANTPTTLTATYAGIAGDWSFTYSIDGGADVTVNVTAPTTTATYDMLAADYVNATASQVEHTVKITSLTTPDAFTIDYSSEDAATATANGRLFTLTVEPLPTTGGIATP